MVDELGTMVGTRSARVKRRGVTRIVSRGTLLDTTTTSTAMLGGGDDDNDDSSVCNRYVVCLCAHTCALPKGVFFASDFDSDSDFDDVSVSVSGVSGVSARLPKNVKRISMRSTGTMSGSNDPELAVIACDVSTGQCVVSQCVASEVVDRLTALHRVEEVVVVTPPTHTCASEWMSGVLPPHFAEHCRLLGYPLTAVSDFSEFDTDKKSGSESESGVALLSANMKMDMDALNATLGRSRHCFESRLQLAGFVHLWRFLKCM